MHHQLGLQSIKRIVQPRATTLVKSVRDNSYKEILLSLGLPLLQHRRLRADIIGIFRILNDSDLPDKHRLFKLNSESKTKKEALTFNFHFHKELTILGTIYQKMLCHHVL